MTFQPNAPRDTISETVVAGERTKRGRREKLAESSSFVRGHYHLSPSGVASLYKFLYVLGSRITRRYRQRSTQKHAHGAAMIAMLESLSKVEACVVPSFVRPSGRPYVRPSVRRSVHPFFSFGGTGPVIGPKLLAPLDRPKIIHPHVPRARAKRSCVIYYAADTCI